MKDAAHRQAARPDANRHRHSRTISTSDCPSVVKPVQIFSAPFARQVISVSGRQVTNSLAWYLNREIAGVTLKIAVT